jgi:hypothetical protein
MPFAETTMNRPTMRLAGRAEPRPRSLGAELVDRPARRSPHDDDGGIVGLAVGTGILLIQACAIIPGLLPCLLLALPLVLPVLVLGAVAGILVGLPLGIGRLVARARRPPIRETAPPGGSP